MKAFIIDRYGPKHGGRIRETVTPSVGAEDILVEVCAASINPLDAKLRDGEFKLLLNYKTPLILGHDVAGVVVGVGAKVHRFQVGDEIYARPRDGRIGTLAEFIAINQADAALKPKNLSMVEAASIPLVGLTTWQALVERAKLKQGQKVLIHAGAGGVGTFAIQLAKHLGATVATTTSATNFDLVKGLGADVVIDYKNQNFEKILTGYDVVLNSQDGTTLQKSLDVLAPGGQLISISGPPDREFAMAEGLSWLLQQVMRFLSFSIRKRSRKVQVNYSFLFMRASGEQLDQITPLIEAGIIRPVICRIVPFSATNEAFAFIETGRAKGKIVVKLK